MDHRHLVIGVVLLPLLVSGGHAQPTQRAEGIYLEVVSKDNQPFDVSLMMKGAAMEQSRAVRSLSRSFPLGTMLVVISQVSSGSVSLKIEVIRRGEASEGVMATGDHVLGEVLSDTTRVAAF